METKLRMLMDHESQYQEWLPWVGGNKKAGKKNPVRDEAESSKWIRARLRDQAKHYQGELRKKYKRKVAAAEAYQVSEYGARPGPRKLKKLFPF